MAGHPKSAEARRLVAEASRRRGARWRAEAARQLLELQHLTNREAALVVGRHPETVRSIRAEYGIPGATAPRLRSRRRDERGRLLPDDLDEDGAP